MLEIYLIFLFKDWHFNRLPPVYLLNSRSYKSLNAIIPFCLLIFQVHLTGDGADRVYETLDLGSPVLKEVELTRAEGGGGELIVLTEQKVHNIIQCILFCFVFFLLKIPLTEIQPVVRRVPLTNLLQINS